MYGDEVIGKRCLSEAKVSSYFAVWCFFSDLNLVTSSSH